MSEWVTESVDEDKMVQIRHQCPTGPPDPLEARGLAGGGGAAENVRPAKARAKYLHGAEARCLKRPEPYHYGGKLLFPAE